MRAADLMISSIKTGIAAAFIVLLFNTVSSMFDKTIRKNKFIFGLNLQIICV